MVVMSLRSVHIVESVTPNVMGNAEAALYGGLVSLAGKHTLHFHDMVGSGGVIGDEYFAVAGMSVLDGLDERMNKVVHDKPLVDERLLQVRGREYIAGSQREEVGTADGAAPPAGRARGLADGAGNPDKAPGKARAHHRVFDVFKRHGAGLRHDLLQSAFLIREVAGGIADDYKQEAASLYLFGEFLEIVQVFLVVRGDIGSHHGGVETH